jgi:hypothetical protein
VALTGCTFLDSYRILPPALFFVVVVVVVKDLYQFTSIYKKEVFFWVGRGKYNLIDPRKKISDHHLTLKNPTFSPHKSNNGNKWKNEKEKDHFFGFILIYVYIYMRIIG